MQMLEVCEPDPIVASISSLLPDGGLVVCMQASFDDSGNSDKSLMVVAGYFFRDAALAPFNTEWRAALRGRRFHMQDLVHGNGDFADLGKESRAAIGVELIETIKRYATLGVAVSVELEAYHRYIAQSPGDSRRSIGSPYSLCSFLCLATSAHWMEAHDVPPEETVYFFESGNRKQGEADQFLNRIRENPALDQRYRYVSHGFAKKNKLPSLDAADLLGWEWTQQCRRLAGLEKRPTRKSLKSLAEIPHIAEHFQGSEVRLAFVKMLLEPHVVPHRPDVFSSVKEQFRMPDHLRRKES
jgi:hypothetical protein